MKPWAEKIYDLKILPLFDIGASGSGPVYDGRRKKNKRGPERREIREAAVREIEEEIDANRGYLEHDSLTAVSSLSADLRAQSEWQRVAAEAESDCVSLDASRWLLELLPADDPRKIDLINSCYDIVHGRLSSKKRTRAESELD